MMFVYSHMASMPTHVAKSNFIQTHSAFPVKND